jgi:hypothetical protein
MRPIFIPERARALRADWAPGPGVLVLLPPVARSLMCSAVIPSSWRQKTNSHVTYLDTETLNHPYRILDFNLSNHTLSLDTQTNQWAIAHCSRTSVMKLLPSLKRTNSKITYPDTGTLKYPYIILGFNLIKQTSFLDTQTNQRAIAVEPLMKFLTSLHIPCNAVQHLEQQA